MMTRPTHDSSGSSAAPRKPGVYVAFLVLGLLVLQPVVVSADTSGATPGATLREVVDLGATPAVALVDGAQDRKPVMMKAVANVSGDGSAFTYEESGSAAMASASAGADGGLASIAGVSVLVAFVAGLLMLAGVNGCKRPLRAVRIVEGGK